MGFKLKFKNVQTNTDGPSPFKINEALVAGAGTAAKGFTDLQGAFMAGVGGESGTSSGGSSSSEAEKDFNKHLLTAKHNLLTSVNKKVLKNPKDHICSYCNREYKSRVGLWKHMQKCSSEHTFIQEVESPHNNSNVNSNADTILQLIKQNQDFKSLIVEQQKENQTLQKQLIEVVKDGKTINNMTTNNNNQKFNLNFFLNTTCKDAMNMSEFIGVNNFQTFKIK